MELEVISSMVLLGNKESMNYSDLTPKYEKHSPEISKQNDLPLLKWPGGKRSLVKYILPLIPSEYKRYYEPFAGGSALFFTLKPDNAVLADINPELINCYSQVKTHPDAVIYYLKQLKNTEKDYYKIRNTLPNCDIAKAARLIYLTTLSFNGIYRLNLKGLFNVPYGKKTHVDPCNTNKILTASQMLSNVELRCMDFEETVLDCQKGDLIYFDPPYTVAHGNNGFIKYNSKIFSWEDQIRLVKIAKSLADKGCKVIISNAYHSSIQELYKDFKYIVIERSSVMAAASKYRRKVSECIFYN